MYYISTLSIHPSLLYFANLIEALNFHKGNIKPYFDIRFYNCINLNEQWMRVNVNGSSKKEFENKNTLLGAEATSPDYIVRPSVKQLQITPLSSPR